MRKIKRMKTVCDVFENCIVNDDTEVVIRDEEHFKTFASGNWYQDNVLKYLDYPLVGFTYLNDNRLYVDIEI